MQLQKHMQPREKAQAGVANDSYHEMSTESTSPSKQRRRRRRKKGRKKRLSSDVSSSSDYSLPSFVEESSDDISDESSYLSDDQLECSVNCLVKLHRTDPSARQKKILLEVMVHSLLIPNWNNEGFRSR